MAKYRKKPVVVDAEQWRGIYERGELVVRDPPNGVVWVRKWWWPFKRTPVVKTMEGDMRVTPPRLVYMEERGPRLVHGSWIITGVKGEMYPCDPEIFDRTYEPVQDAQP